MQNTVLQMNILFFFIDEVTYVLRPEDLSIVPLFLLLRKLCLSPPTYPEHFK